MLSHNCCFKYHKCKCKFNVKYIKYKYSKCNVVVILNTFFFSIVSILSVKVSLSAILTFLVDLCSVLLLTYLLLISVLCLFLS